ncbi:tetratricopeptide repeat protein [Candidatus Sumerlaeota bacterium]|nr:tetratricopeptide repeat protein [Candidatus Sumerlaeota bacterium]
MTRREVKQDELKDFSEHIAEWFQNHSKSLGTVLTVLLCVFAAYMVFNRWQDSRTAAASAEYAELVKSYNEAVMAPADKLKEKVNATVLAATELIDEYGDMPVGRNARLLKGNVRYYEALSLDPAQIDNETSITEFTARRDAAFKEARASFDDAYASSITSVDKAEARLALAQTQESMAFLNNDKQLVSDAINNYKSIIELVPGSWLSAEAALGLGRMMQAQVGKQKEAVALYAGVAKDRALPAPKTEDNARLPKDSKGNEIPASLITELRQREKVSYQAVAKKAEALAASEESGK